MDLHHLRYVVVLAEELHFRRAAERLHMSQPPLSRHIRDVEQELGVNLFHRTKRGVQVTHAGQKFIATARRVLSQLESATDDANRAARGEFGKLVIGSLMVAPKQSAMKCIRAFSDRFPEVRLEFRVLEEDQKIRAVSEGAIDVAFVVMPISDGRLTSMPIARDRLLLGLPQDHPLGLQRQIPLTSLSGTPFALGPQHLSFLNSANPNPFRRAGFAPRITHQINDLYSRLAVVKAGLAVSIFPACVQEIAGKGIIFRKTKPSLPSITYGIAFRPDNESVILRSFLSVTEQVLAQLRLP